MIEEVRNLLGDFIAASITDKGIHGSPIPDIIRQGVDELLGALDTSHTKVSWPQKNWAMVDPSEMAGVSEKTVSVATASFHLGMLKTGFLALKCFLR